MIHLRSYTAPPMDRREILRYAGVRGEAADVEALLEECLREAAPILTYRACFCELEVKQKENRIMLGEHSVNSSALAARLQGCSRAVILAATVGIALDRLIARYSASMPSKAVLFSAIGDERVEALCDCLCEELSEQYAKVGATLCARFSPGYGDLPLEFQNVIFSELHCSGKLGLCLGENLLMTPSKSVTAIVGIKDL